MIANRILIVDDEKNIRSALGDALAPLGYEIALAESGQRALELMRDPSIRLVLLDLKMPGIGGIDVLRRIERERPDLRVLILTAHGTVDTAVESMKRGAVDVLQKPVAMEELRQIVRHVMERDGDTAEETLDYQTHVDLARKAIRDGNFDAALAHLRTAANAEPSRPEAFNLLGVIFEVRRNRVEAQKQYRIALDLDGSYEPAAENLSRSMRDPTSRGAVRLGDEDRANHSSRRRKRR